jgi:chromate transporter
VNRVIDQDSKAHKLTEICLLFLKLGTTSFGGPAVHIAMMEEEVVRKRKWLTHQRFLDLVSMTNLIPGPNSTELAIHIGHLRAGWLGLIVAGISFIVPAMVIVLGCAWFYVRFGQVPQVASIFYGIKPVVIAIVLQALWSLGTSIIKSRTDTMVVVVATALSFVGINELAVLLGAGSTVALFKGKTFKTVNEAGTGILGMTAVGGISTAIAVSNSSLFLTFLKIGSVLYGSGYVLLAFLRADFVERLNWLSEPQLLDAVAIGQITPGPVFTTATFIGYLLNGSSGALVATAGIFLPAFIFVGLSSFIVPHIRKSKTAGSFLDGLNLASFSLMAMVSFQLGSSALVDTWTILMSATALFLLVRYRINSLALILAGASIGFVKWLI